MRAGRLVLEPVGQAEKERRKFLWTTNRDYSVGNEVTATEKCCRDFVALAVASEEGIVTQEHTTGMDGDREKNMVEFARLGLELLKNAILQSGKGPAEGNM